jgi:phage-related protein
VESDPDKPVVWLHTQIKTPPFSSAGRTETGGLLRRLQQCAVLEMPHSRPMPTIGPRCHELRIRDAQHNWRIIYRVDEDAILVVEVFAKNTRETPRQIIELCRKRLAHYDAITGDQHEK